MDSDKIVYMRVPAPILNIVDEMVAVGLYSNRAEVLRELLRGGMKAVLYQGNGGYCPRHKQIVDCCSSDE